MAKFKKALALVLSLAMVLTLAPIASVNSKAAAKYKISAKTTAISAGKTYNVKVTGVKKGQYVKVARTAGVTVKYNGKTIKASKKVAGTGKALTFKVTVPDKVANYKSTIKAVIYNKKTNKKVKTLSTKRTVKVSEFSIASVVSIVNNTQAANLAGAGGVKYLRATFTKAIDALDASEVEIYRKSDNQLFSVASVKLASNGKSADLTLVGDDNAANVAWLKYNVDYVLKVSKSGATAELAFNIPAVIADASIVAYNSVNKTITTAVATAAGAASNVTLTVPSTITIDYEEVLGRTATIQYNKDQVIEKFELNSSEKVVYGAFVVSDDGTANNGDGCIVDAITGEKYYSQRFVSAGSTVGETWRIEKAANGSSAIVGAVNVPTAQNFDSAAGQYVNGTAIAYGKLILNSTGTVKIMVVGRVWGAANVADNTSNILVTKVNGTSVLGGTTEVDFKNYVILKDGKTISTSDIAEGDVVFYNTTNKFAEVYTNKKTGALEAVYNNRFAFGGKTYDVVSGTPANLTSRTRYVKSGGGLTNVDDTYLSALKSGGKDVTVYFSRSGAPVYLTGETGEVATTSVGLVLTADSNAFNQSLVNYIRLTGWDGKETKTYDIDISKLETIVAANGTTYKKGYANQAKGAAAPAANAGMTGFVVDTTAGANTPFSNTEKDLCTALATTTPIVMLGTDMKEQAYVTLTVTEKGVVTGINLEDQTNTGKGVASTVALTKGMSTIDGLQLSTATPIYVENSTTHAVTTILYGDYAGSVAIGNAYITSYDDKNVKAIVVDSANIAGAGTETFKAIVTEVEHAAGTTNYINKLTVLVGNNGSTDAEKFTKMFTKFATNTIDTAKAVSVGSIVDVTVASDKETVTDVAITASEAPVASKDLNVTSVENKTFTIEDYANELAFASTEYTLAKIENGVVTPIDFATLKTESESFVVDYSRLDGSDYFVDALIVRHGTARTSTPAAYAAAQTAIDALTAANLQFNTVSAGTDDTGLKAKAAVKLGTENINLAAVNAALTGATIVCTPTACSKGDAVATAAGDTVTCTVVVSLAGYTRTITGVVSTLVA